jgi:hypothetical protein
LATTKCAQIMNLIMSLFAHKKMQKFYTFTVHCNIGKLDNKLKNHVFQIKYRPTHTYFNMMFFP